MKNLKLQLKIKKLFFLISLFFILCSLFSINASPVLADDNCGWGEHAGFRCCLEDSCYGGDHGQLDCVVGRLCCKSCTTTGITDLGPIGGEEGFGPWGNIANLGSNVAEAAKSFTKIVSNIIGVMTIAGGIWFMFQFIAGGLSWLTAGGDKAGVQAAQKRITNAVIGLTVVVAAYALIWIIGELLGFDILHPEDLIKLVGP
ncbi:hypothetical protein ISS86_02205 [Candidatus Microgenomates bacterium]|nr:hypothetical protein [Candidatus Microgenomates bacterium]